MPGEAVLQATLVQGLAPEGFVPNDCPTRRSKPLADSAFRGMATCSMRSTPLAAGP